MKARGDGSCDAYFDAVEPGRELGAMALRGGGWVLLAQIVGTGVRVLSSVTLARLLMPADFGLFAMVLALSGGLLIFKDLGLCDAVIQWPNLTRRQVSSLFWVNLAVAVAVAACFAGASPLLGMFYDEPRLAGIAVVWSMTIVLGALSAQHLALLKRALQFSQVSKVTMAAALVSNIGAIVLGWRGAAYWALVAREILNEAVIAGGAWLICRWRPHRPSADSGIRPMLVFGGHSIVSFIIRRTVRNLDRTLLGWRFGAVATGYYHSASELSATFTTLLAEPLRNVAVSSLSRLRGQPERFRQHYLKAIRGVAIASFGATALLVATSNDLIALVMGPKWLPAAAVLRILGLSAGISGVYLTGVWLHFSLGRADRMARWAVLDAILIGGAVTIGVAYGASGVAWAYTSSTWFLCIAGLWYAGRPAGLRLVETIEALWRPAVGAGVAGGVCWYITLLAVPAQLHAVRLSLFCASFAAVYGSFLLLLGEGAGTLTVFGNAVRKWRLARS